MRVTTQSVGEAGRNRRKPALATSLAPAFRSEGTIMHSPMPRLRLAVLTTIVAVLAAAGAVGGSVASAAASDGTIRHVGSKPAIPGRYLVGLKATGGGRGT